MKKKPSPKFKLPPKKHPPETFVSPDDVTIVREAKPVRLITKAEVLRRVPVSYPCLWGWMRDDKFPRSKSVGGRTMWVESEVERWIDERPDVPLKPKDGEVAR